MAAETHPTTYVRYTDGVETREPGEQETFQKIIDAMGAGGVQTRARLGHSVRTSHAKAHALLKGELRVHAGLPEPLRQGLFAEPRSYGVIARLSHVPGDLDDDRKVSGPRGMSLKVLGVGGEMLPGHEGQATQDWVLDTGKVFNAIGARTFLAQISPVEQLAPKIPQPAKGALTAASLAGNKALHAVGADSAALDFFGHPFLHPLVEAYYSQAPIRYGAYIAKLNAAPSPETVRAAERESFKPQDYDALRTATAAFFRGHAAEFTVGIQLCTNLRTMPIEDANQEWPEDESPYQPVATLSFPAQDAWSPARVRFVDEELSFCPSHSLAAHRPLGSIMRARMAAYEALGRRRREENGSVLREPQSMEELPD